MSEFTASMDRVALLIKKQSRLEIAARRVAQTPQELNRLARWIYTRISNGDSVENVLEILEWEGGDE